MGFIIDVCYVMSFSGLPEVLTVISSRYRMGNEAHAARTVCSHGLTLGGGSAGLVSNQAAPCITVFHPAVDRHVPCVCV